MSYDIGQIGMAGDLWKTAIYNFNGELIAFAVQQDDGEYRLGFVFDASKGALKGATLKEGKQLETEDWKDLGGFQDSKIKFNFGKNIPQKETILFEDIDNFLCLISFAPIFTKSFNEETNNLENKQIGFVTAILKLDNAFISRVSTFAGTDINIFNKKGLSIGNLKEYKNYDLNAFMESKGEWSLAKQEIFLNDVKANGYHRSNFSFSTLPSGLYLVRMEACGQMLVSKVMLIR